MPLRPYGKPPTRCLSTCSDGECLLVSEQAQVLKGSSVHETVPPSGYLEDGTNHDECFAPEPTPNDAHRPSYSASAATTNGPECTIVNTVRGLPVFARVISPESWGTGSRLPWITVIGILISLGLISQWSALRLSYSATAHPADHFLPRRMSTIDVVRIEKSTRTDRTPDVVTHDARDADPPIAEEVHEIRQQHRNLFIKNMLMFMPVCFLLMIVAHMHPGGSGGADTGCNISWRGLLLLRI